MNPVHATSPFKVSPPRFSARYDSAHEIAPLREQYPDVSLKKSWNVQQSLTLNLDTYQHAIHDAYPEKANTDAIQNAILNQHPDTILSFPPNTRLSKAQSGDSLSLKPGQTKAEALKEAQDKLRHNSAAIKSNQAAIRLLQAEKDKIRLNILKHITLRDQIDLLTSELRTLQRKTAGIHKRLQILEALS